MTPRDMSETQQELTTQEARAARLTWLDQVEGGGGYLGINREFERRLIADVDLLERQLAAARIDLDLVTSNEDALRAQLAEKEAELARLRERLEDVNLKQENVKLRRILAAALRDHEPCDHCWGSSGKYSDNHPPDGPEVCPCLCHRDDRWPNKARQALAAQQEEERT